MTADAPATGEALRTAMRPLRRKSTRLALVIAAADLLAYAACVSAAIRTAGDWRGCCFALAEAFCITMLFIVGHDACHGSFTAGRKLNALLGRLVFLPSLTPFHTWEEGHNRTHHVYTNLKPRDYVWTPFTKPEFDALPRWRQSLERLYRTAPGVGIYYAREIWWKHLWLPLHPLYWRDCWLCAAYGAGLSAYALTFGLRSWLVAVLLPFLIWNCAMGWAIYLHHTHPDVPWFDNEAEWRAAGAQLACTIHVVLPWPADAALHFIMHHTAHHLDVTIPMYQLRAAQRVVEHSGARVITYRWTLATFLRHLRTCKLYDFDHHRWLTFDGRPCRW